MPSSCPPSSGQEPKGWGCLWNSLYPAVKTLSWRMSFGQHGLSTLEGPALCWILRTQWGEGSSLPRRSSETTAETRKRISPDKEGGITILHKKEMYLKSNWCGWSLRAIVLKKNIHFDTDVLLFIEKSPLLMITLMSPFFSPGSYSFYLTHCDTIQTQETERNTNIADRPPSSHSYWKEDSE